MPSRNCGLFPGTLVLAALLAAAGCAQVERKEPWRIDSVPATQAVTTAHPLATRAALDTLAKGGSAIDAVIAAQAMLGLVEPQSSGVGGGLVILIWDAGQQTLTSFDGLASAPSTVTAGLRIDTDGTELAANASRRGGRTVAVPGALPTLKAAHERFGKLPWRELFEPAIEQALAGFALPPYMHSLLAQRNAKNTHADMVPFFFGADGNVFAVGTRVRNPRYAATLSRIAEHGPGGLLRDGGAERIVAAAQRGYRPTLMTEHDLSGYQVREREPICGPFLAFKVCTMGPTSFGGMVVLQLLQMVEARAGGRFDFSDPQFAHIYVEAGRLAQADRRRYVGDPDFVTVPIQDLISRRYLQRRAQLIDASQMLAAPLPGEFDGAAFSLDSDPGEQQPATSQIAIADRLGNAVSVTTTINLNFGSRLMAEGIVLNNAMINFAPAPAPGRHIANKKVIRSKSPPC